MMAKTLKPENLIAKFRDFLADTMGLYYPLAAVKEFEKKLQVIAKAFGFSEVPQCLEWLMRGTLTIEQIAVLAHHLTIGETYFFRDKNAFALLEQTILPRLLQAHKNDRKLRIWSAACCSGEEPYSIAMLLQRLIPKINEWNISILGTDINQEFLEKGQSGIYKHWSFRATAPEIQARYFRKSKDNSYSLIPEIKKMVRFSYLNLVEDSYPDPSRDISEMDLIICSNVLIYFSPKQINKTINHLSRSLHEEGWLLVSPIESPYVKEKSLKLVDMGGYAVFQKVEESDLQEYKEDIPPGMLKSHAKDPTGLSHEKSLLTIELPSFLKLSEPTLKFYFGDDVTPEKTIAPKNHEAASPKVATSPIFLEPQHPSKTIVEQVQSLANAGKLLEARSCCEKALQQDKLDPLLHYLLATILQFANDDAGAIQALKKALFLDDKFIIAHFTLGVLMLKEHHGTEAQRHLRNARKLLEKYKPNEIVPGSEDMTVATLLDVISKYQG